MNDAEGNIDFPDFALSTELINLLMNNAPEELHRVQTELPCLWVWCLIENVWDTEYIGHVLRQIHAIHADGLIETKHVEDVQRTLPMFVTGVLTRQKAPKRHEEQNLFPPLEAADFLGVSLN